MESVLEKNARARATGIPDFDEWVSARSQALLRLAYVLTGNQADAEDVVQDALSRALPRWSRICQADDVDAYVRRMVVNANVSRWRRFRRRETPTSVPVDGAAPAGMPSEERDALWQACQALPANQRTAIVLRFYEDLDYAQIAALTGVREGSVRSRVSRGVATLREELGEWHD
ncbi:SigE family RNA polymerase sigma factor [Nocardioides sp.]|uniref:SigE family RNA polymerase sigma factor n=1 Tax=Nocardioides sp. TaxID=35761 RepID=UPI002634935E|nr:SigE family RNA polymerase sigma factor [Nocardioides sp.]